MHWDNFSIRNEFELTTVGGKRVCFPRESFDSPSSRKAMDAPLFMPDDGLHGSSSWDQLPLLNELGLPQLHEQTAPHPSSEPPTKKRKRNEEPSQHTLQFSPLQPGVWPALEYTKDSSFDLSNFIEMNVVCHTELTPHKSGALIHYKRNQMHFTFTLTQHDPPQCDQPLAMEDVQVLGSDLNLENLHLDIQIVESPHLLVHQALENITSSATFIDRPSNLAGPANPIRGVSFPPAEEGDSPPPPQSERTPRRELQERVYFERATASNGNKRQCYFFVMISLCASNPWNKCALQTFVSVQPLIVRGSNPGAYKKKKTERKVPKEDINSSPPSHHSADEACSSDLECSRSPPSATSPSHDTPAGWQVRETFLNSPVIHTKEGTRVGINTNNPREALSVHGNIEMTGHLMRPSDRRIKQNLRAVNNQEQLERIRALKLYDYHRRDLATGEWTPERGVIAQELAEIMPSSVQVKGDIVLPNGQTIQDFCTVNERDLMIEHLGATQALASQVDRLEQQQEGLLLSMIPASCTNMRQWAESGSNRVGSIERKLTLSCWGALLLLLLIGGVFYFRDSEHYKRHDWGSSSSSSSASIETYLVHGHTLQPVLSGPLWPEDGPAKGLVHDVDAYDYYGDFEEESEDLFFAQLLDWFRQLFSL